MPKQDNRVLSTLALSLGLIAVTVLFGVPESYPPAVHLALAIGQMTVLTVSAWFVGASAIFATEPGRQRLALAGILLLTPWALFSFLAGFGPPDAATPVQNQLRYIILFLNTIAIAGGSVFLWLTLRAAGERRYSSLGVIAVLIAAALYVTWAPILFAAAAGTISNETMSPESFRRIGDTSDLLLFFGGLLFYVATLAFAISLSRAGWLGRVSTVAFVAASAVPIGFLLLRGLAFPDPNEVFQHWYLVPGYVAGIPAVPWFAVVALGVILLRRVAN